MPEIQPGVVFQQAPVQGQELSGANNDFEPAYPVSCHPVPNNLNATGVRGDVTADLARATGGKVNGVMKPYIFCSLLDLCGDCTRLTGDAATCWVNIDNPIHSIQRQDQLTAGSHGATAQTSTASRRYDRRIEATGELDDLLNFCNRLGK